MRIATLALVCFPCVATLCSNNGAYSSEPLHQQIDALLYNDDRPASQRTTDLEFLRRVTLDLAGRIPTLDEIHDFEAQPEDERRRITVDRLLDSSECSVHLAEKLDIMLMERRGSDEQWRRFLRLAMADRMSWSELTRHLVNPQADDARRRGAAMFIVKRLERYGQNPSDLPGLVRDVGRHFLGRDVQCAQCHDHLYVDDYKQVDYQGMLAFVGQAEIRRDTAFAAISQKLMTSKVEFASVFDGEQKSTGPRVPGRVEIEIPSFPKGEEYLMPPDRKTRFPGVPKFQPLGMLADQLTAEDNEAFARNFANRMWWLMMGRGIVHPLDMHHAANPPSHPRLLRLLAAESRRHQFDIRWLLRELALSEAYQRESRLPPSDTAAASETQFLTAIERPLSAEQLCRSTITATRTTPPVLPPCESVDEELWPFPTDQLDAFQSAFANPPKDPEIDYRPSVKAALFLMNSEAVHTLLCDSQMVKELASVKDLDQFAEHAYLRILTRRPTTEERREAAEFLQAYGEQRSEAATDFAWALLSSTEFLVNH